MAETKFYDSPAYIGYANEQPDDKRIPKWEEQFNKQGFDDSCTWSLDYTIIKFITPRLKRFLEIHKEMSPEDDFNWELQHMLDGFELYLSTSFNEFNEEHKKKVDNSFYILSKCYRGLWW